MLSILFCLLLGQGAFSDEHLINSASDLIEFSRNVNNGNSYSGTTVFLDADMDFVDGLSGQFEPIGKNYSNSFQGTFNGQGHTINNLAMNSSSQFVGLFGYLNGATIRNVVLDSSCSVVSSCIGSVFIGGIMGQCYANNGLCVIENNVNMASISFTGSCSYLYFGGIVGYLSTTSNDITVRNCANYGSVTHSGTTGSSYIGGVVGYYYGRYSGKSHIQNCLNYGTITYNGTTANSSYIGGILGDTSGTNNIENCVSGGKSLQIK